MPHNSTFVDRLFDRLDRLDPANVQSYVQRLVREKGFLESIFNSIHEGIIVLDENLCIRYTNIAARELLGLNERADGARISRFVKDVDWRALANSHDSSWQGMGMHEMEVFYPCKRILTFYMVPHPYVGGEKRFTLILQDVSAQRRMAEDAIESEKVEAVTQLAAGVAHEIGNPLNSLTIHLQLLARELEHSSDQALAEESRHILSVAQHEVSRLDSIINSFLRAVRPVQPQMAPLHIQKVLVDALTFMRSEIEDRGVRVEASLPDHIPVIQGDAAQLKQVFFNVLKNSLQAMNTGGLISIECRVGGEFVEIRFADTGKGISNEDMGRIFQPYFTTRANGTGLGLLVVERIMRAHGGEIGIESEAGSGATVILRLPLHERQARLLTAAKGQP